MDPFGRIPIEIREYIISYLLERHAVMNLCEASPVFMNQLETSNLLKYWDTLHHELGHPDFQNALALLTWPNDDQTQPWPFPCLCYFLGGVSDLPDPLFTSKQGLIIKFYEVYRRMMDNFARGPTLVPTYLEKYAHDSLFTVRVATAFGSQGEHFPIFLPPRNSSFRKIVFSFLIAIEVMDNGLPSAKQLTRKEERSRQLLDLMVFRFSPEFPNPRTDTLSWLSQILN